MNLVKFSLGGRESPCGLSWSTRMVCLYDCFLMRQIQVIHLVKLRFCVTVALSNLIWIQLDKEIQVSNKIATNVINMGVLWEDGSPAIQSLCWDSQEHTEVPQPVRKASYWAVSQKTGTRFREDWAFLVMLFKEQLFFWSVSTDIVKCYSKVNIMQSWYSF